MSAGSLDVALLLAVLAVLGLGAWLPGRLGRRLERAGTRREPLPRAQARRQDG